MSDGFVESRMQRDWKISMQITIDDELVVKLLQLVHVLNSYHFELDTRT